MSEAPKVLSPAVFSSTVPMLSAPELFLQKMSRGHDQDAARAAGTILEGVYAAYDHSQKENAGQKARKIAALRGRVARDLLGIAYEKRVRGEQYSAIMDETIGILMPEVLRGWLAEDDVAEIVLFEDALLRGHPHHWMGHVLERDKSIYDELAKEGTRLSHFPYDDFVSKLLRILARAEESGADNDMIDLVLTRFIATLGHDWLSVMARTAQALYVQPGYVPTGPALDMTLDYARAMGETYNAMRSLSSELFGISYPRNIAVVGPRALRFSTEDWYGEGSNPSHYERRMEDYVAEIARWCLVHPGFAVEIVLTVRRSNNQVWHEYKKTVGTPPLPTE